jgi:WD40 repeat protein
MRGKIAVKLLSKKEAKGGIDMCNANVLRGAMLGLLVISLVAGLVGLGQEQVPPIKPRLLHSPSLSGVTRFTFSPDGRYLAAPGGFYHLYLIDTSNWQVIHIFDLEFPAQSEAFSPDGKLLATMSIDRVIRLWNVATGQKLQAFIGPWGLRSAVGFSPDGKLLAFGKGGDNFTFWDVVTATEILSLEKHPGGLINLSPDGKFLASAALRPNGEGYDAYYIIDLWDLTTGKELYTFKYKFKHTGTLRSEAFSSDGKIFAFSYEDKDVMIKLLDVVTGQEIRTLKGHTGAVISIAFSPDGKLLASSSLDKTVKLWDVSTGRELCTLWEHMLAVGSVAFSPDGKFLVTSSPDSVKILDVEGFGISQKTAEVPESLSQYGQGQIPLVRTLEHTNRFTSSVAFSPDGKLLASVSGETINLWEVSSGSVVRTLSGGIFGNVTSMAFSPDGRLLASGYSNETIKLWEVATGREVRTLEGHTSSVAFSPDGQLLASGSGWAIKLWEVATGREVRTLEGHSWKVTSVAFSPDGRLLASGSEDETIKLWDVATGQEVRTLKGSDEVVTLVTFSPDGKLLASVSGETINLWDVAIGQKVRTLRGHTGNVKSVAFSPDGKFLASGACEKGNYTLLGATLTRCIGGEVKLWKVATGCCEVYNLSGHTNEVTSVAFSPDGKLLASCSREAIKLWDIVNYLPQEKSVPGNQSPTVAFAFTPVSPKAGDEVTFDASASHDPDGSITSYRWDFGDGVEGAGEIVKHVFAQEGTYTVTLTVTDNSGLSKSLSKEVTVSKAAAGPESHSQLGQALHVTFLKVYYGETDFGEQLILHLAIKNMSQETQYLFGAPGGVPQGNTMYVQDSEGRVYYPRSLLGFAFQIVPGQTVENEFPFPVPKAATGLKLYIRTSAGWESFPIPLGVPSSRRLRLRVMEGRYTEIAAPLYSRMDLSKQEWKVGVINKRDMWYLVRYYKKNPGEGNWEEFGTRATEVIKHRNLLWPYGQNRQSIVLNEGDLVKIEISNEAGRDPVLTGIIIVDFFSRALLGSPWAWEDENMVQFLAKVTDKINKVYGVVAHAIAEGPKGVVARIVELLKEEAFRLGVIEVLAKTLKIPQQQLAQKLGGAPTFALSALSNIPYWWSFAQNISKPPFVETLVFKVEQAEGASLQNLVLTNGLKASKSEPYFTGDTVRLNFTLTNRGKDTVRIHVGLEGTDPSGGFIAVGGPGWGSGGVELAPGTSFTWEGELNLTRKGIYKLYPVYLTEEGIKVDNIPAEPGATASLEIAVKRYSFLGLQLFSPAELRVYDSEGRVTGVINEKIKEEIPSSFCLPKQKVIVVLNPTDTYKYEVLGTGEGSYSLIVVKGQEDEVKTVSAQQMPISPGVVHQYSVDWEVLGRGEKGVTIQIDQDIDGVFESVVLAGDEVIGGEIGGKPAWWPLLVLILIVLALSLSIVVYQASRGKSLPGRSS